MKVSTRSVKNDMLCFEHKGMNVSISTHRQHICVNVYDSKDTRKWMVNERITPEQLIDLLKTIKPK